MKRIAPLVLLWVTLTMIAAPFAWAAMPAAAGAPPDNSPASPLAAAVSAVTGIAISPLLGTGAYGAYQWMKAKDDAARAALPWYAHWEFFVPALLIVGACAAKDALGTAVPPGLKKPLDLLELVENKTSGLVAAGAVVPFTMAGVSKMLLGGSTAASGAMPGMDGFAMVQVGAMDGSALLSVLTIPFGVVMFGLVWMASHAINVLIMLSPWGAIDAALKALRTALLGLLALTSAINPWIGALLSLVVLVVAYLVAGWAFRLTVFGTLFCWEFLTGKKRGFSPRGTGDAMFAGGDLDGVPVRTFGRLVTRPGGGLDFVYKPWLVLPERTVAVPATTLAVGRGVFLSTLITDSGDTLFLLPPRYRGHEDELARVYPFAGGVREAGLRKAWSALRELFGGGAAKSPAA